jgi:hypothetical protein
MTRVTECLLGLAMEIWDQDLGIETRGGAIGTLNSADLAHAAFETALL